MSKSQNSSKPTVRKGGRKPILSVPLVAAALVRERGNVAAVAREFGVARSSVAEMVDANADLKRVVRDAREAMKDEAEDSLCKAVRKGEAWAVCFFLKTQAKDRGYIEKQEIETSEPVQLHIVKKVVRVADRDAGDPPPPGAK